jgi:hypothetical protein
MGKDSNQKTAKNSINRRGFLKNSALGAAGFSIVPLHVLGGTGYTAPSDKLHIVCIGCGNEAHADIQRLSQTPGDKAVIAYLCDVDDRQAGPPRKQFPKAKFYYDWRELFRKEYNYF